MTFAEKLKNYRASKGLRQIDMAEALGLTEGQYRKLEDGRSATPRAKGLARLEKHSGKPVSYWLGDEPVIEAPAPARKPALRIAGEQRAVQDMALDNAEWLFQMLDLYGGMDEARDKVRVAEEIEARLGAANLTPLLVRTWLDGHPKLRRPRPESPRKASGRRG